MVGESDRDLVERVGEALRTDESMVAVAESSTGGLTGSLLTDIPGSSEYFERSVVSYSNEAKTDLLAVAPETIDSHGAVSAETAEQMARGVRELAGTKWAISTTGIAGPGGGTSRTPIGTIYIGVAQRSTDGSTEIISVNRYEFEGSRRENKLQFARRALSDLYAAMTEND